MSMTSTARDRQSEIYNHIQAQCDDYNSKEGTLTGYDCPKCKNKGYIAAFKDGYEVLIVCECAEKRRRIRQMEQSGLQGVINAYSFHSFICKEKWQTHMRNLAMRYAESSKNEWLFFGGQTGAGKTHLCTAVCAQYLRQGIAVKYMMWKDISKELKRLATDSKEYERKLKICKDAEVLYIDDLFKGKTTEPDIDLAFEIINYRYTKRLKTIISSELTIGELAKYDKSIAGRIIQNAGPYLLNISADDDKNYRISHFNECEQEEIKGAER